MKVTFVQKIAMTFPDPFDKPSFLISRRQTWDYSGTPAYITRDRARSSL